MPPVYLSVPVLYFWSFRSFPSLLWILLHVQFNSVAQLCPTLCDPMDCSTPGLPVYHQLPEFTQTHVHWVGDSIKPSHPVIPFSSFHLSQHQGLFKWVSSSLYWSFSFNISTSNEYSELICFKLDWLDLPAAQRNLRVFSNTTVQKHQFYGVQLSL